jgi:anti-sigma factor RsiW
MHPDEELLQRALHGELAVGTRQEVLRHLDGCAECVRRIDRARREEDRIFALLGALDRPIPMIDPGSLAADPRSGRVRWGRRAAVVLLALGAAGAAYAAPGSPLPGWVDRLARWIAGPAPAPAAPVWTGPTEPVVAGISVSPGARLTIHFATEQRQGQVTVSLTDGSAVTVRAVNGSATFTTGDDRLDIGNRGSTADYEIELPSSAPWVELRVGDRGLWLKRGQRVVTDAVAGSGGHWVLSLLAPVP